MAIFGKLEDLKKQVTNESFKLAFDYLENIDINLLNIKVDECIKKNITDDIFVLTQAYNTKNRQDCFFESHKKYIDIQYMIKGDEIMDVAFTNELEVINKYDEKTDFIKYKGKQEGISSLLIKEKELAIFYPSDAHQPCIKVNKSVLIYKAVIKIPVELV